MQRDDGIASLGSLPQPGIFATFRIGGAVPFVAGAGFVGNGEGGGLVNGEGEHNGAVAAVGRLTVPGIGAALGVFGIVPGVGAAGLVADLLIISGTYGQREVHDAVAGARTLDGHAVGENAGSLRQDVESVFGIMGVQTHLIGKLGDGGRTHGKVQTHNAVAVSGIGER